MCNILCYFKRNTNIVYCVLVLNTYNRIWLEEGADNYLNSYRASKRWLAELLSILAQPRISK